MSGRPEYALSEVFNETEIPDVTFVRPREFSELVASLLQPGKHVTLSGPSGCGKTTLARKTLAEAEVTASQYHWVSGRDYRTCGTLGELLTGTFACDADEVTLWLQAFSIVVIDDFHHLLDAVRNELAHELKRWHELNIRFFLIGIAETSHELLDADPELGFRNEAYEMKTQDAGFIAQVMALGETALNISFTDTTKAEFVKAANGIPSAIHVLCRNACTRSGIRRTQDAGAPIVVESSISLIKDAVLRSYKGKYFNKVVGLAKGKQQARSVHDTYFEIIRHISLLGKSVIHVEELRERIVKVTVDQKEQNRRHTSFYNCLKNLPAVIQERQLNDALYFNATSKTISIEDPSFAFYLKLVDFDELKRSIRIRRDDYVYDVAISFAGEQRAHASGLKEELERLGYSVFYDFDEKHILWGQNLRSKLADVYARDAKFMVVMLSKEYPEKDWPAFEFEVGKEAKRGRVAEYLLPLVVDDVHVVGLSSDVGHLDLRRMSVAQVAQILAKKIEESPGPLFERGLAP